MNTSIKIGMMPGKLHEFALEGHTTVAEALALAELNPTGYTVKLDGEVVTDHSTPIGDADIILLVKQIKGN